LAGLGYPVHNSVLPGPLLTRAWDRGVLQAPRGFDVIHAVSLATLEPGDAVLVSTVHDLLWRRLPEAYPPRGKAWHEAALQRALRRADRFIVTSDPVACDLEEAGASPDAITIIPMGGDHLPPPDLEAGAALLERIGVHGPFLLSVGTLEPRKNLHRLTDAYRRIRGSLPEPWPLVLVGPSGWGEQVRSGPGVVLAGLVTPEELSALYSMTRLLAYVPLIEGFGLPPVEAMVFGTPVVASPLPSTAGAAFEVDPRDCDSIARGLLIVATDATVRTRLQEAGRRRAAELKWSTIARSHVSVWDEAATRRGGRRGG
jgi:alpha-1,3-rhamnosyl/mannosyltransferase